MNNSANDYASAAELKLMEGFPPVITSYSIHYTKLYEGDDDGEGGDAEGDGGNDEGAAQPEGPQGVEPHEHDAQQAAQPPRQGRPGRHTGGCGVARSPRWPDRG